ncbi:MAG TPA: 1-acyl-sn-glycerol-3-phosphate acyltransferase [Myxococcaceae bacterium]|nr:1-acyl-sn-glycerol-3-phosphate acyltransferase [Myxococcaceae bacterium]
MFYRFVRAVVGFALRLFYRVTVRSRPDDALGPVMFVGNHPNAIIDPALVFVLSSRRVTFLAKEPLFRTPVMGSILRGLGALPVYRKQDNPALMEKNEGTFEAAASALASGGAITLFPEGKSHSEPSLAALKTGAARIAFRAARAGARVRIIPVGLTYAQKHKFRSEVLIDVDPPIEVAAYLPAGGQDEAPAVRALTEQIEAGLRRVTLNLETWEDLPVIQTGEELYALKLGERAHDPERLRRFAKGIQLFRAEQPERFERMRGEVASYRRRLELVRSSTRDLGLVYRRDQVWMFTLRNLVALFFGLPLFLLGLVLFALPFYIPRWLNRALDVELDQQATVKFLGALALAPLVIAGLALAAWRWLGAGWAVTAVLTALPLALFTRYFLEHWREVLRDAQVFFTLGNRGGLKARLLVQGEKLAAEIEAIADELRPRLTQEPIKDLRGSQ